MQQNPLNLTNFIKKRRLAIKTGIDLTAMVDVVLLIVIFFLTTSSFKKLSEINIELPSAANSTQQSEAALEISITEDGSLYMFGVLSSLAEVRAQVVQNPQTPITVLGDRRAKYETIIDVMDSIKQAGGNKISLTIKSK